MHSIEVEAKSIKEAILIACEKLETTEEKLHIDILEDTPNKILSLFSGKKAKIRASLSPSAPLASVPSDGKSIEGLQEILEKIVKEIDEKAYVEVKTDGEESILNIIGDGSGIFIGKRGQTLEAFQYLMNKIKMNKFRDAPHITIDSESYHARHVESLVGLALRLSDKAKKRKGPVTTNPLNAGDRRIVHMALKKDAELSTWSKGEGNLRKVIIAPKQSE
ncbi:MAG: RNA-binding cell elongation regulator Jag/EloR [Pseudomonadota bacterium]